MQLTSTAKSDIPQGTLDLLIMQVAALGPIHGYAIAQRLQQISRDVLQVQQGTLYPACIAWRRSAFLQPNGNDGDQARSKVLPPDGQRPQPA